MSHPHVRIAQMRSITKLFRILCSLILSLLLFSTVARGQVVVQPAVGQSHGYNSIVYAREGDWLVSGGGDGTVAIWDLKTGGIIRRFSGTSKSADTVSLSPDRKLVASISGPVQIWDVETGKLASEFDKLATNRMAMSPDWGTIAVDSFQFEGTKLQKILRTADRVTGGISNIFRGHSDSINRIVYSVDGRFIATASDDKTGRLWEAKSGKLLRTFSGHTGYVKAIAILKPVRARRNRQRRQVGSDLECPYRRE